MTETADQLFIAEKFEKGIRMIKKSIDYYDRLFGKKEEYFDYIIQVLNSRALKLLGREQMEYSFFLLKSAEKMMRNRKGNFTINGLVETFNNLSFWFQRAGNLKQSLEYIQKARGLVYTHGLENGLIEMNITAVHSLMNR